MKYLCLFLVLMTISCTTILKKDQLLRPDQFNFENSTQLAKHQDKLLAKYKAKEPVSETEIQELENNLWVRSAVKLAPGNLVIRQWCLIDLLRNKPAHARDIHRLMGCLSSNKQIWLEGYSYFTYTLEMLDPWEKAFSSDPITGNIEEIEYSIKKGFAKTAYLRYGICYPAPFGDLRDGPILRKSIE